MKKFDVERAKGNFIEDLLWFLKRRQQIREQRTFAYCPICHEDLCSNFSLVLDGTVVKYHCTNCGEYSEWNFDLPAPLLLNHSKPL
jgi:hypothetical protein